MKRALRSLAVAAHATLASLMLAAAEAPPWEELMGIVRSNLVGVTETELNAAAVRGLLEQFPSRLILETNAPDAAPALATAPARLARTNVFDGAYACLRITEVASGLADAVRVAMTGLLATNELKGLVLDLRYAGGREFEEAGRTADLFVSREQALLDWGNGSYSATAKTNAFELPLTLLVNGETQGAAEALAAALRTARSGLVIGSPTAGQASVFKLFPLSNGQQLRVAVAPVKVGDETPASGAGLTPDIAVPLSAADERAYFDDPFKVSANALRGANRVPRLTEADLVRLHREGIEPGNLRPRRSASTTGPAVTDPVLLRALDLLKGLAVLEARPAPAPAP